MDKDFTLVVYQQWMQAVKDAGYVGIAVQDYDSEMSQVLVLRQDVDKKPENSVRTALIQADTGFRATYYFRMVKESYNEEMIREISEMGHEIGYHYEDLAMNNGDLDKAWESFQRNLDQLRELYPVNTITMHGSPMSKWDNRDLWKTHDYKSLGLTCEPYMDFDFSKLFYLTDTGGRWNDTSVSVRDYVEQGIQVDVDSTHDLISKFREAKMPERIMQNIHPQRWTDSNTEWYTERAKQGVKNVVKKWLK